MSSIFYLIAKGLSYPLEFVYDITGSYAATIIIMALIVKMALYPLYHTQMKQSLIMQRIKPRICAIKDKYAESADIESMKAEIVGLYEQEKVNPMFSVVILLVQIPFLFGLFTLLRHPGIMGQGVYAEAAHQAFFWVPDLTAPDGTHCLPLVAALATFASLFIMQLRAMLRSYKAQKQKDSRGNRFANTVSPSLVMSFVFPVLMFWFGLSAPSGIVLYGIVSCAFSAAQSAVISKIAAKEIGELR